MNTVRDEPPCPKCGVTMADTGYYEHGQRCHDARPAAAPRAEGLDPDDANWLRSHREHDGHWRCSGVGDNGEPCEVIRAAPRAEGLNAAEALQRVKIALTVRANTREGVTYHSAMEAVEAVERGLSRPSDERVGEEPR